MANSRNLDDSKDEKTDSSRKRKRDTFKILDSQTATEEPGPDIDATQPRVRRRLDSTQCSDEDFADLTLENLDLPHNNANDNNLHLTSTAFDCSLFSGTRIDFDSTVCTDLSRDSSELKSGIHPEYYQRLHESAVIANRNIVLDEKLTDEQVINLIIHYGRTLSFLILNCQLDKSSPEAIQQFFTHLQTISHSIPIIIVQLSLLEKITLSRNLNERYKIKIEESGQIHLKEISTTLATAKTVAIDFNKKVFLTSQFFKLKQVSQFVEDEQEKILAQLKKS